MKPSLFALYKRGNYLRRFSDEENSEREKTMEERERFIVAALAFCCQHDPKIFGKHFYENICQVPGDPEFDSVNVSLEIEQSLLDLVLINETANGQFIYVVETKAGADLANHQNPKHKEFWNRGGYGSKIAALYKNAVGIRYITLGHSNPSETTDSISPPLKWKYQEKYWGNLADGLPTVGLGKDFAELLTQFRIDAFMFKRSEGLHIRPNFPQAIQAYFILADTCASFGLQRKYWEVAIDQDSEHDWYYGINLRPVLYKGDTLGNQKMLTDLLEKKDNEPIAWFGYEGRGAISVWFYCGSKKAQQNVQTLFSADRSVQVEVEEPFSVLAVMPQNHSHSDRQWFTTVFEKLGLRRVNL
jgi:hypothetical protein